MFAFPTGISLKNTLISKVLFFLDNSKTACCWRGHGRLTNASAESSQLFESEILGACQKREDFESRYLHKTSLLSLQDILLYTILKTQQKSSLTFRHTLPHMDPAQERDCFLCVVLQCLPQSIEAHDLIAYNRTVSQVSTAAQTASFPAWLPSCSGRLCVCT